MRLRIHPLWVAALSLVLGSGCALQSTRYDYSRLAAGLGDYDESIIDWNFPTSANQGLLLPPERFRPSPPALGVPWATGEPMPWHIKQAPARDGSAAAEAAHEADARCPQACDAAPQADTPDLYAGARLRERSGTR